MSGPHEKLARLRRDNLAVQQKDPKLAEESRLSPLAQGSSDMSF
jgi:hypothetical protein